MGGATRASLGSLCERLVGGLMTQGGFITLEDEAGVRRTWKIRELGVNPFQSPVHASVACAAPTPARVARVRPFLRPLRPYRQMGPVMPIPGRGVRGPLIRPQTYLRAPFRPAWPKAGQPWNGQSTSAKDPSGPRTLKKQGAPPEGRPRSSRSSRRSRTPRETRQHKSTQRSRAPEKTCENSSRSRRRSRSSTGSYTSASSSSSTSAPDRRNLRLKGKATQSRSRSRSTVPRGSEKHSTRKHSTPEKRAVSRSPAGRRR